MIFDHVSRKSLPLFEGAKPCVGCGFCCKRGPCGFGEHISSTNPQCVFLKEVETDGHARYICEKYDEIIDSNRWEMSPAFGAGCCCDLFNSDRDAIIKEDIV